MRRDERQMSKQHPLTLQSPPALANKAAFETRVCGLRLTAIEEQQRMTRFRIPAERIRLLIRTKRRVGVTNSGLNVAEHTIGVANRPRRIVWKAGQRLIDVRQRVLQGSANP